MYTNPVVQGCNTAVGVCAVAVLPNTAGHSILRWLTILTITASAAVLISALVRAAVKRHAQA
ncbi:MAG TPA: hypothetical protein VFW90_03190 [Candidatus Saccharimonadales bacterium]|nr:hypothetical protein [Candidatus Saccharimonadales bacterium]